MKSAHVPFLDLRAAHDPLRTELLSAIGSVIDANAFAGGSFVTAFEEDFAAFCRAKYAVGVGNGTDALWFTLLGLGIGPGDEVVTVPLTFIATAEAITFCGARPVFVDIEPTTYTMDPERLEQAITPRTKAIIPVHLYGQTADMSPIREIAARHRLPVIEDACQAHGAEYKGERAGSLAVAGAFSFYPGKNLGALGEAGAVVTNSEELAGEIRILRDHGQETKYHHARVGWNGRMDGIQAAALRLKLKHLNAGNAARRAHAAEYDRLLAGNEDITLPVTAADRVHVYHLYVVRVQRRDQVIEMLKRRGVSCGVHYPIPLHLQPAYRELGHRGGSFPVAEKCAGEVLSLPMFPELTHEQINVVAQELQSAIAAVSHGAVPATR